jgi:hypothetical protein
MREESSRSETRPPGEGFCPLPGFLGCCYLGRYLGIFSRSGSVRIYAKFEVGGKVEKIGWLVVKIAAVSCRRLPAAAAGRRLFARLACRRASQFEIRRINVRLGVLEERLSESRLPKPHGIGLAIDEDDPKLLEKEIQLQRRRLLDLLSEEEETAPSAARGAQ